MEFLDEIKQATALEKKSFSGVLLTDMFMHGPNNNQSAEWRMASYKGILRYWWRSIQTESNLSQLAEKEQALFGGTEKYGEKNGEKNGEKSKILLSTLTHTTSHQKERLFPHKPNKKVASPAIRRGTKLSFEVSLLKREDIKYYSNFIELLFYVSGFGQRSRRGFGALQPAHHSWGTPEEFLEKLETVIHNISPNKSITKKTNTALLFDQHKYPFAALRGVYLGSPYKTAQEVSVQINHVSSITMKNFPNQLGSIQPRKASSLLVTVRKIGDSYYPVICEVSRETESQLSANQQGARKFFKENLGVKND